MEGEEREGKYEGGGEVWVGEGEGKEKWELGERGRGGKSGEY